MRPEIPRPPLVFAVVFGVAAIVLIALCTVLVAAPDVAAAVDVPLHHWFVTHRSAALTSAAIGLTTFGTSATVLPVILVAGLALSTGDLRRRAVVTAVLIGVAVTGLLARLGLSMLIARPRPPTADWATRASGLSFPSGHSTDAVLIAGLLGWLLFTRVHGRWARAGVVVLLGVFALAMGATRMYLGVHWPLDVLGGWAFGCFWLCGAARLITAIRRRVARRAAGAAAAPR